MISIFRQKQAETFVSVIIGVAILSILTAGIANILYTNFDLERTYDRNNALIVLQSNATNIIRKIDTSSVPEKQTFTVYRNSQTKTYDIFTGSDAYKYIDSNGDLVSNTGSENNTVYTRYFYVDKSESSFWKKNQIIKVALKELVRK